MVYAPFGQNVLGETLFGVPPTPDVSTEITITPVGYSSLLLTWLPPSGEWDVQILVRSAFGIPQRIVDGVVLLNESSAFSNSYTDTQLKSGHFYYYALFVNTLI